MLFTLGDHPYQKSHVIAEYALYVLDGVTRILHHIMKKRSYDRIGVEMQLTGRDGSHRYGMQYVRLARLALLGGMGASGKAESPLYTLQVRGTDTPGHGVKHHLRFFVNYLLVVHFALKLV